MRSPSLERDDKPGGLLRYGIPDYKQPKAAIDRRLSQLEAEGIAFRNSVDVGVQMSLDELRRTYDAVVLATGAQCHRDLQLPGRDLPGIHFALPYLIGCNRRVARLSPERLEQKSLAIRWDCSNSLVIHYAVAQAMTESSLMKISTQEISEREA